MIAIGKTHRISRFKKKRALRYIKMRLTVRRIFITSMDVLSEICQSIVYFKVL